MRLRRSNGLMQCGLPSAVLCCMAFWVIYWFAVGTTPLRPDEYCWDSAFFQAVGKLWADGLCPYVDIFDHKGPLLFLIQKMAYHFNQPRMALYVIESLFVSVSLLLCQQILRLKMGPLPAFGGTLVMLAFWLPLMEYGNLSETYSMPFVLLALLLQLRYWHMSEAEHPVRYAFVYGLCFGANLMIRPNNGLLIPSVTLVITIVLALRRKWLNLAYNAILCGGGVILAVLPFIVYFASKGALNEFVYAVWSFNLIYADHLKLSLDWNSLRNVLFFITPALLCGLLGMVCFLCKYAVLGWTNLICAAIILASTLSGVGYAHYFMLHVPLIPLALYTAAEIAKRHKRGLKSVIILACFGFVLLTLRTTLSIAAETYLSPPSEEEQRQEQAYNDLVEQIEAQIPPAERDSVAMCGLLVSDAEMILNTELHPVGRYCFLLEWHAQADPTILNQYAGFLKSGEARWVLMHQEGITSQVVMDAIAEQYELMKNYVLDNEHYLLYRVREPF